LPSLAAHLNNHAKVKESNHALPKKVEPSASQTPLLRDKERVTCCGQFYQALQAMFTWQMFYFQNQPWLFGLAVPGEGP